MTFVVDGSPARIFTVEIPSAQNPTASLTRVMVTPKLGGEAGVAMACDPSVDAVDEPKVGHVSLDCHFGNPKRSWEQMTVRFTEKGSANRFDVKVFPPEKAGAGDYLAQWRIVTGGEQPNFTTLTAVLQGEPKDEGNNPLLVAKRIHDDAAKAAKELGVFPIYDSGDGFTKARIESVYDMRVDNGEQFGSRLVFQFMWTAIKANGEEKPNYGPSSVPVPLEADGPLTAQVKSKLPEAVQKWIRTQHWSGP